MRSDALVLLTSLALAVACGDPSVNLTDSGTEAGTDTSSGTGSSTAMSSAPTSSSGAACMPGTAILCACADSSKGTQVCRFDGAGYEMCDCEGGGSNSASAGTNATNSGSSTTEASGTTGEETSGSSGDGSTGGPLCEDPGPEPNDVEDDATDLGDQLCSAAPQTLEGVLSGEGDADWFTYHGTWSALCVFGPNTAHTLTANDDVRMCVFVECDSGAPAFACQSGVMAESPDGRPGCCNSGDVDFTLDCGLFNDNARLYIRLDEAPADACVEYAVEYSYDE